MYFILEDAKETKLNFAQGTAKVLYIYCVIIFSLIQNDSMSQCKVVKFTTQ